MATPWSALCKVRERSPLVQCITNFVSMDLMANSLLAIGASPAMVHAKEEVDEFVGMADALCVNLGTLSPDWVESMKQAASRASASGKPWVLDPVGCGATVFRTRACRELLALGPSIVRGNASEILALAGAASALPTKGVDSSHEAADALEAGKELAMRFDCVVAVSGATDFVTDGRRVVGVSNGVAMLQKITATGCAVTALVAAFAAVSSPSSSSYLEATAFALAIFGLAAEIGMLKSSGPATLRLHLLDALHALDEQTVASRVKLQAVHSSSPGSSLLNLKP